jgi:hypothetical protein
MVPLSAPTHAKPVPEAIATLAPHGDWWSSRTAAPICPQPGHLTKPRQATFIAATNPAGAVGIFLWEDFGAVRQPRASWSSSFSGTSTHRTRIQHHIAPKAPPTSHTLVVGGQTSGLQGPTTRFNGALGKAINSWTGSTRRIASQAAIATSSRLHAWVVTHSLMSRRSTHRTLMPALSAPKALPMSHTLAAKELVNGLAQRRCSGALTATTHT